jgi:chromatin segregation and condensation protein Rec8/ScpA/Scc1 (kleisin family)
MGTPMKELLQRLARVKQLEERAEEERDAIAQDSKKYAQAIKSDAEAKLKPLGYGLKLVKLDQKPKAKTRRKKLSEEDKKKMQNLRDEGVDIIEIAGRFHCSMATVYANTKAPRQS